MANGLHFTTWENVREMDTLSKNSKLKN